MLKGFKKLVSLVLVLAVSNIICVQAYASDNKLTSEAARPDTSTETRTDVGLSSEATDLKEKDGKQSKALITDYNDLENYKPSSCLQRLGPTSVKKCLVIDNIKNPLYRTFDDPKLAIENLKEVIPNYLKNLSIKYDLDPMSDSNWQDYREKVNVEKNEYSLKQIEANQESINYLNAFFDIYENDMINSQIETALKNHSTNDSYEDIIEMLPYFDPSAIELNGNKSNDITIQSISGFDAYDGSQYAEEFAEDANKSGYGYLDGDCTNFVSQILEAGGVPQDNTGDKYSGWWHTSILYINQYSRSWTQASTFCNYWGVSSTFSTLYSFSANIVPGDIIALDNESDGSWDHVGFVDQTGTYNDYNGKYYKDFKVAQHTYDYCAWASTSTNGWDEMEDQGATYGIV